MTPRRTGGHPGPADRYHLTVTGGLTDLTMRDVGVLGLALALTGQTQQRLTLTR